MGKITIFIPKYRMVKCNRVRWKYNKHKRPFYLLSEINGALRKSNERDEGVLRVLFKKHYKARYKFNKQRRSIIWKQKYQLKQK